MPEDKEKNGGGDTPDAGVSVRVPQWMLDEVETERNQHPRPRPSRGELIARAWKRSKSIAISEDADVPNYERQSPPPKATGKPLTASTTAVTLHVHRMTASIEALFSAGRADEAESLVELAVTMAHLPLEVPDVATEISEAEGIRRRRMGDSGDPSPDEPSPEDPPARDPGGKPKRPRH